MKCLPSIQKLEILFIKQINIKAYTIFKDNLDSLFILYICIKKMNDTIFYRNKWSTDT